MSKKAVLLFSMGGPDRLEDVQPYLFNLFHDECIVRAPQPIRYLLAKWISHRRAKHTQEIYKKMDGRSPLKKNTLDQARALEERLRERGEYKCFVGMSYWHPFIEEMMKDVATYGPEEIILLPLYPQYSTTTTASVLKEAKKQIRKFKIDALIKEIASFQTNEGFIKAMIENIEKVLPDALLKGTPKILFSAHGLPEQIVKSGDPYPIQCEETASSILKYMGGTWDAQLCYQSRVGPLKWIGPETVDEIIKAARAKRPIVIVPIAFVSEHSETLVEIDREYRYAAEGAGCPHFVRCQTVGVNPSFMDGLARLVYSC